MGGATLFELIERADDSTLVTRKRTKKGETAVVRLDPNAAKDYELRREGKEVRLTARTDEAMEWLIGQYLSATGEKDKRFRVDDLPRPLDKAVSIRPFRV